jgi:hypothetical protein
LQRPVEPALFLRTWHSDSEKIRRCASEMHPR